MSSSRVNYVTYGSGYCDNCGTHENLVMLGHYEWKGICKSCLPAVIEQMKNVSALLKCKQEINAHS